MARVVAVVVLVCLAASAQGSNEDLTPSQFMINLINSAIQNSASAPLALFDGCTGSLDDLEFCGHLTAKASYQPDCSGCNYSCDLNCGSVCCSCGWTSPWCCANPACGACEAAEEACKATKHVCDAGCSLSTGLLQADVGVSSITGLGSLRVTGLDSPSPNTFTFAASTPIAAHAFAHVASFIGLSPTLSPSSPFIINGKIAIECSGANVTKADLQAWATDNADINVMNQIVDGLLGGIAQAISYVPGLQGAADSLRSIAATLDFCGKIGDATRAPIQGAINKQLPLDPGLPIPICTSGTALPATVGQ